jgi:hypothetical protein
VTAELAALARVKAAGSTAAAFKAVLRENDISFLIVDVSLSTQLA